MPGRDFVAIGEEERIFSLLVFFELGHREEALYCVSKPLTIFRLKAELCTANTFFLGCHASDNVVTFVKWGDARGGRLSDDLGFQVRGPIVEPLDEGHSFRPAVISIILQGVRALKN